MTSRSRVRAISAAVLAATGVLAVSGCSGGGDSSATPSATTSTVSQTCAELLPSTALDVYGAAFEQVRSFTPEAGTPAATIADRDGRVCRFREVDDHDVTITVAVAKLPEKSLTNLKDALFEQGTSVPTYRVEGYFDLTGGVGRADAFADPYWITASSTLFTEPGGAQPVIDAVRAVVAPDASPTATP